MTSATPARSARRLRPFALIALFAWTLTFAPPVRAASTGPDISHYVLANGLELVVIPDHRTPVVTHMIWYKVGSADETPGKSGLAHFLEHLMFKGTAKNPAGKFSEMVATIGGQENAFTTNDYTGYFQRTTREYLPQLMAFEADRMTGLVLTDEVVKPELNVVLEEYNQRIANQPSAQLDEQVSAALYLNHPYGRPVIGWHQEIVKLTRDDALAFYRRFYTPNNAVVVVAGDVKAAEVKELADKIYGTVARRAETPPRVRPQEPTPIAERRVTVSDPRVAQPNLRRSYLVPSYASAKPPEAHALEVLAHILGGGTVSRLYTTLVVDKHLASNAGGWYIGTALDASRLVFYATPRAGVTLPQLESALDGVLAEVVRNGVTAEELERAKNRLVADAIYANDNQATLARMYGAALTTGSTVSDVQSWPERIKKVTAEQVRAVAEEYLDRRRSVTGYLVPAEPIKSTTAKPKEKRS